MSLQFKKVKSNSTNGKVDAFDSDFYLKLQIKAIKDRIKTNHAKKVYIEFGGKIFDDLHASRVLPGYFPDMKFRIIKRLFNDSDIIFVVSAKDILRKRIRGDHKITYDLESLRMLNGMQKKGVLIKNVVITRMPTDGSIPKEIKNFETSLKKNNRNVFLLKEDIDHIDSMKDWSSYDNNSFVPTKNKYVIILSPGGGSGKFGVCINQLYHEMKKGITPFYIKFETFPVHDLSVIHPVNLAYMAASADFYDLVMKDPRKCNASSYNRDIENYELLHTLARYFSEYGSLLKSINSATNMGVNVISKSISNWEEVEKESAAEIGRRLIRHKYEVEKGQEKKEVLERVKKIISFL
jgi:uncharacterized protein (UPF0371 family)